MTAIANTPEELGKAIKNEADEIIIYGDWKRKIVEIKGKGKVAWGIAFAALVVAIALIIASASSGGTTTPVTGPAMIVAAPAAVSVLGVGTTLAAVSIAVGAGSASALTKLRRNYNMRDDGDRLILTKK